MLARSRSRVLASLASTRRAGSAAGARPRTSSSATSTAAWRPVAGHSRSARCEAGKADFEETRTALQGEVCRLKMEGEELGEVIAELKRERNEAATSVEREQRALEQAMKSEVAATARLLQVEKERENSCNN